MFFAALLALSTHANAATYEVDASHSHVRFSIVHMTISKVRGGFGAVTGTVVYDEKNPTATTATGSVAVSTIDTAEPKRDEHLLTADFFDAIKFPDIRFASTSITATAAPAAGFDLVGNLTLHGVTKPVTFHLDPFTAEIKDPKGNFRRATHATATINRQDFGMTFSKTLDTGGFVVSDEVQIELDLELKRL
ncbi:MAG: polyisoprenoid-binding protein [Myxococcales bacterium]|nr:polyisoprenoid-binding protein [Myxococcales bacterium]